MRYLTLMLLAVGLGAADPPKSLTDTEKLAIRTLQLRLARVEAAKAQIQAEEKAATEELSKLVQGHAAKGCLLKDDLTCEQPKPEVKEKEK